MAAFQYTREKTEQKVMVHLLSKIERNPSFTQRGLARDLGIALGLMNQYLKRCVAKGWVRASQVSPRRICYFLTPEGFKEKSHMVKDYLSRSMVFFRDAREQCEEAFIVCKDQGLFKIALVGTGDLAEIAKLVSMKTRLDAEIIDHHADLTKYDAFLITDIMDPQGTYDALKEKVNGQNLLTLELLHISKTSCNTW
jgi:DNA-binding MarR family transcriptional regulator